MRLSCSPFLLLHLLGFLIFSSRVHSDGYGVAVKLLSTPNAVSRENYALFSFRAPKGSGGFCTNCSTICQLDNGKFSACEGGKIIYTELTDGNHSFEVCTNGSLGVDCTSYNWTIDTVNPTAQITAATTFTNASQFPVNISFSEPCGGGFKCFSVKDCNLLVYGSGEIVPSTLDVLKSNMKYSIDVAIPEGVQYGRLILVMDKNFCTDVAGNEFTRTANSTLLIHFDRRSVFVNLRIHVPEKKLQINSETRTVLATNKNNELRLYLYFTEPVMNSSEEVLNALNVNDGSLVPISGSSFGRRRFGYQLTNISELAIVTVNLNSDLVISRQGTPVFPVSPLTFLCDSQRPTVKLSTTSYMKTKEKSILIFIKFLKPVFGFNTSSISITGGDLQSFFQTSRSSYAVHVEANSDTISVSVPENVTRDVAGNRNKPSNTLQLKHYSIPLESSVISSFATAAFALTAFTSGLLTISTSSLLSAGAFNKPSSISYTGPTRSLFRIASHLQVVALSRWLAVPLPIEYYELTRGLQWTIPYFSLPWESGTESVIVDSSSFSNDMHFHVFKVYNSRFLDGLEQQVESTSSPVRKVSGRPLTPMEYRSYFESQTMIPEAEYLIDPQNSYGWRDFGRIMFWLAVIGGTSILLHAFLLSILRLRRQKTEKSSVGALIFPRYELFLLVLAVPSICAASVALIKGGSTSGITVGIVLLSIVAFLTFSLLLFLSFGISFGKLLQYKEVHELGLKFHWYQELIRVTLGPGKRGQWTWKNQANSVYLTRLGPLFEDLRGPPKYMLSQIAVGSSNKSRDSIIQSDDETEDAEAPCIQKLFGILRIYYTLIEFVKRLVLGITAGAYSKALESKTPTIIVLSVTAFQLFFILLKKPFLEKKTQLVEIASVSFEAVVFAICCFRLDSGEISPQDERKFGISMLSIFLFTFLIQMMNEWNALYQQVKHLDLVSGLFSRGMTVASTGWLLLLCPRSFIKNMETMFPVNNEPDASLAGGNKSLYSRNSADKPWLKQLRELARSSFNREGIKSSDPSTSKTRWSGLWKKRSGNSSSTSIDHKSRAGELHKELEEIFASK